jgi:hypothetical protein
MTDWHKALLWFLGAVAMLAVAGVAPNVATWLLIIIITGVFLGHWNDTYKVFFGLK